MLLVFAMMIGIVLGFILGLFAIPFSNAEKRTAAMTVKVIILSVLIVIGCVVCLMKDWSFLLSYGLGVIVGASPYFTSRAKKETEKDNDETENGNQ